MRKLWIKCIYFFYICTEEKKKRLLPFLWLCFTWKALSCYLAILIWFVFCFLHYMKTFHHVYFHFSYKQKNYYSQCKEICSPLPKPGKCTAKSFLHLGPKTHLPARSMEVLLQQARVVYDNRLFHFQLHQTIDLLSPGSPF